MECQVQRSRHRHLSIGSASGYVPNERNRKSVFDTLRSGPKHSFRAAQLTWTRMSFCDQLPARRSAFCLCWSLAAWTLKTDSSGLHRFFEDTDDSLSAPDFGSKPIRMVKSFTSEPLTLS